MSVGRASLHAWRAARGDERRRQATLGRSCGSAAPLRPCTTPAARGLHGRARRVVVVRQVHVGRRPVRSRRLVRRRHSTGRTHGSGAVPTCSAPERSPTSPAPSRLKSLVGDALQGPGDAGPLLAQVHRPAQPRTQAGRPGIPELRASLPGPVLLEELCGELSLDVASRPPAARWGNSPPRNGRGDTAGSSSVSHVAACAALLSGPGTGSHGRHGLRERWHHAAGPARLRRGSLFE